MATPTYGVLDTVLNNFRTQIDSGFGTLTGAVEASFGILIVVSVASMAIMWAVDETDHIWGHLIRKIFLVGFWSFIITQWHSLSLAFISAFGKLGIGAGGGGGGLSDFLNNPSKLFKIGLDDASALFDYARYCMGVTNHWGQPPVLDPISQIGYDFKELVIMIEVVVAAIILIVAYGWLAIEVVITVLEFHIVTLVAFCVLPFGVLRHTNSLAENAIGYVFRAGFKAMVLGIIIGLGSNFLSQYTIVESPASMPSFDTLCGLAIAVIVILMLALHAPKYASAVVAGAPANSAGSLVGTAVGVGATGFLAGRAAVNGGRALISAYYGPRSGASADAARAASSLGGPGRAGGASPGAPRPPSPSPAGGGAPAAPSSGGAAFAAAGGPGAPASSLGAGVATEVAAGEIVTTGAAADSAAPASPPPATGATTLAPDAAPSLASASDRSNLAWYATPVGLSSLTSPQLAAARRSYHLWSTANPALASRYSFDAYVEYAQARHAEGVAAASRQDEA
jgi:type IV secretion system protein TrbL